MKIGIFDSGLGGLSVLHEARKLLPNADYIYYADEAHVPYGEKKPEEIRAFVKDIFEFMIDQQVDAIVIACNTATSMVNKAYREQFPVPIVGMEPAVKKAVDLYGTEEKRILVAATPITIGGNKLHNLVSHVDTEQKVDLVALPGLVRLAEKGHFNSTEVEDYLHEALKDFNLSEYGTVVLGCTHFNYFKESFQTIFKDKVHFLDGNQGTIHQLMRLISAEPKLDEMGTVTYYFSGEEINDEERQMIEKCMQQLDQVFLIH